MAKTKTKTKAPKQQKQAQKQKLPARKRGAVMAALMAMANGGGGSMPKGGNGQPGAERGADMIRDSGAKGGAGGKARMMNAMQQGAGNARLGRMFSPELLQSSSGPGQVGPGRDRSGKVGPDQAVAGQDKLGQDRPESEKETMQARDPREEHMDREETNMEMQGPGTPGREETVQSAEVMKKHPDKAPEERKEREDEAKQQAKPEGKAEAPEAEQEPETDSKAKEDKDKAEKDKQEEKKEEGKAEAEGGKDKGEEEKEKEEKGKEGKGKEAKEGMSETAGEGGGEGGEAGGAGDAPAGGGAGGGPPAMAGGGGDMGGGPEGGEEEEEDKEDEELEEKMAKARKEPEEETPEPEVDEDIPEPPMQADKEPTSRDDAAEGGEEKQPSTMPLPGGMTPTEVNAASDADAADASVPEDLEGDVFDEEPDMAEPEGITPEEKDAGLAKLSEQTKGPEPAVGGGGGGGAAIPDKPEPPEPNVAGKPPGAALSSVGALPPVSLAKGLAGVTESITKDIGDQKQELADNPPTKERPSGAPQTKGEGGKPAEDEADKKEKLEKTPEGETVPTPEAEPLPPEKDKPAAAKVKTPTISGSDSGEMTEREAKRLGSSVGSMPTRDKDLNKTAGPPPKVKMEGNADPAKADEQRTELQGKTDQAVAEGRQHAAEDMGENQIFPSFAPETLEATIPESKSEAKAPPAPEVPDPKAINILAQEKKGGEIKAAVAKGKGEFATHKADHQSKVTAERAKTDKEIAQAETDNAKKQTDVRTKAQEEVQTKRGELTSAQDSLVEDSNTKAKKAMDEGKGKIETERKTADKEAAKHVADGNEKASKERAKAENEADQKKKDAKKESSGFFGWLASKAKAFFDGLKKAVAKVFELARKAVRAAIEAAKKLAVAVIEKARQAIVAAIRVIGDALIAIGDVLLAGFPELRKKFREGVEKSVKAAEDKVNELADDLKKGVTALLDALGNFIDKALQLLEKAYMMALDAVSSVVQGAIKFAESAYKAFAAFAALVGDVASDPLGWLANLGAGVVDGIKNHLWKAFKAGVQEWFNSKLEQVLGLGKMIWEIFKKGGISIAEIGKIAWEGLKAMIPMVLIQILVEKLVAMIVPAAGAVMVIIEGLQAAWGSVSRIIAAFSAFFTFLKAVKTGKSGPQFATALAAAAVAVIDFVANWLLIKLAKGAAKVGKKIKGLAKNLGKKMKGGKGKGKLGKPKGKKGAGKGKGKPKAKPKTKPKPKPKTKPKKKPKKDNKSKKDKEQKKKDKKKRNKEKTLKAIKKLLRKGVSKLRLKASLLMLKARYGWKKLFYKKTSKTKGAIFGSMSPVEQHIITDGQIEVVRITNFQPPKNMPRNPTGAQYETAIDPYVRTQLIPHLYAGAGHSVETKHQGQSGHGTPLKRGGKLRLHGQRNIPYPGFGRANVVGGTTRRPEYTGERYQKVGKTTSLSEVHYFEVTLRASWEEFEHTSSAPQGEDKRAQFEGTVDIIQKRITAGLSIISTQSTPMASSIGIRVFVLSPYEPSPRTRELINRAINTNLNIPQTNISVKWIVLG